MIHGGTTHGSIAQSGDLLGLTRGDHRGHTVGDHRGLTLGDLHGLTPGDRHGDLTGAGLQYGMAVDLCEWLAVHGQVMAADSVARRM